MLGVGVSCSPSKNTAPDATATEFPPGTRSESSPAPASPKPQTITLSATRPGRITEIRVQEGGLVKKNDILIMMELTDLARQMKNSQAELEQSEDELQQKRTAYLRLVQRRELGQDVPEDEEESTRSTFEAAQARVIAARNLISTLSRESNRQWIRSPGPFRVDNILVASNQMIESGHALVILSRRDDLPRSP
jgi:multidrug efflux pump subunit AcrA (membrane-fusion protein)